MTLNPGHILRILIITAIVGAVILLSAGLSKLTLQPGVPFSDLVNFLLDQLGIGLSYGQQYLVGSDSDTLQRIVKIFYLIALFCFPIALILVLVSPKLRKQAIRTFIQVLIIALLFSFYSRNQQEIESETDFSSRMRPTMPQARGVTSITDQFEAQVSDATVWIASLALALLLAAAVIYLVNRLRAKRSLRHSLEPIASRAESAAESLQRGSDFRNTILQCYVDMVRIVQERRGLQRQVWLTPHEFARYLREAGLPKEEVLQLTELFEDVRYGHKSYSNYEAQAAVNCLNTIAIACRNST